MTKKNDPEQKDYFIKKKLNLLEKINNKILMNEAMKRIEPFINEEQLKTFFETHKGIEKKFFYDYIGSKQKTIILEKATPEDKKTLFSLYFATEYFKRNASPDEDEKSKVAIYFYFINKNFDELFQI